MLSPDDALKVSSGSRIIITRGVSPQRTERGNTVTAGGSGRVLTTEELLQAERRKSTMLEERLQALERQMHSSALTISTHADQMRAMESRAVQAEELAAGLQSRLMRLAELVKQQKQQGFAAAEFEGLLTAQATNAESRVKTLEEELKLEKESQMLLQEEISVAKAAAVESSARLAELTARLRDAEMRLQGEEQRVRAAEDKATQQETLAKLTEQKLVKLVELVKQDKEREKLKDQEREKERAQDREKIAALQTAAVSAPAPAVAPLAAAPPARSSGPSQRELDLAEKLKAADARIQKMTEVMKIADVKVRNAETIEQRAKAAEEAKAQLEAKVKALEEQVEDAKRVAASAISTSQNTDLGALQAKVISYEGKIRMLVDTVKTERASFQKQLAEAKAAAATNPSSSLLAPPVAGVPREGSQGTPSGGPPPPLAPSLSAPPPPPPPGPKKGAAKPAGGQSLANALSGVKLKSAVASSGDAAPAAAASPTEAPRKMPAKIPPLGTPAGNLGSIAEQAAARRAALKPAPLSPRGPSLPPPPPPEP